MGEIIDISKKIKQPRIQKAWNRERCPHHRILIDKENRRLTCESCGVELDPIAELYKIAVKEWELYYSVEEFKRYKNLTADLKAEEKRIKARIRRAQKKLLGYEK